MSRGRPKKAPQPVGQPVAYASGAGERPYGERKQLEEAQRAIPLPVAGGPPPDPAGAPDPGLASALGEGVFTPTRRPDEPLTAGAALGPGPGPQAPMLPPDHDELLRALHAEFKHPDLARLLNRRG